MTIDNYLDSIGITPDWEMDDYALSITGVSVGGCYMKKERHKIFDIRGWGHLQYLGHEKAEAVQRANGRCAAQSREMLKTLIDSTLLIEATWECLPQGEMDSLQHTENVAIIESATGQKWETIKEALNG